MEHQHFDTLEEFMGLKASPVNARQWKKSEHKWRTSPEYAPGPRWWGIPTLDDAIRVCETGWQEGAARIQELTGADLTVQGSRKRRRIARGDFGNEVDLHRIYAGQLDTAWSRPVKQERPALAQVTLLANIGATSNITAKQMFWRGAALLRAADLLASRGHDVEIVGYNEKNNLFAADKGEWASYSVTVKRFGAPLDLPALASTFCLGGFHRYYGFKWVTHFQKKCVNNYGVSHYGEITDRVRQHFRHAIVVPSIFSKDQADAWLQQLEAQLKAEEV